MIIGKIKPSLYILHYRQSSRMVNMFNKLFIWSRLLSNNNNISIIKQLRELLISRLKLRLGVSEYYELEIFDRNKYPDLDLVIGRKRSEKIDQLLNLDYWRATANDKILNYALLKHFDLAIPNTIASYNAGNARISDEILITNENELHEFFSTTTSFPLFVKPVHGSYGRGTFSLSSYDKLKKTFNSNVNKEVSFEEIITAGNNKNYKGLLIQSCLIPHPLLAESVGSNTSCVRVILIRDSEEVFIHRAFWKIARSHNITDNFSYGKHGNLLADIDIKTGITKRVITGLWPNTACETLHPDSGKELLGFQIPDWYHAKEQCIKASHIFPGLSLQSWDIAFCENGPVLMELNTEPNLEVPQLLSEQAFLNENILAILKKRGW